MEYVVLNSQLVERENAMVAIDNRAFNYGDGLFETIRCNGKDIFFFDLHYARLSEGMEAFGIELPVSFRETLRNGISQLLENNTRYTQSRIKIVVWRASGGLYTPLNNSAEYLITVTKFIEAAEIKDLVLLYKECKLVETKFSAFKTCNALPYIMAALEGRKLGANDMILTDHENNIAECISSNIYWAKDGIIYTPSLETGCINGIMRKKLFKILPLKGIQIIEGKYGKAAILKADFAFTTNISGISFIKAIENKSYKLGLPLIQQLKDIFIAF